MRSQPLGIALLVSSVLSPALWPAATAVDELVFEEDFESGDLLGWSSAEPPVARDPNLPGPYASTVFSDAAPAAGSGGTLDVKVWVPQGIGPQPAPYPLAIVAHGFQIAASQYDGYAARLASFGYVAVNADYVAGLFTPNHRKNALDLAGVIDWADDAPELAGQVDTGRVVLVGHSLGGKVSLLAALLDSRVDLVVALDPVDSSPGTCSPADCPDVSARMDELTIPTAFLGEVADSSGFQACAPAADNYTTFYAGTPSPSLEVTVIGAGHLSFLDDVASCGFTCSFCATPALANATVVALARSYVVASAERFLRGNAAYDAYLTGAFAQERYVNQGIATIQSR